MAHRLGATSDDWLRRVSRLRELCCMTPSCVRLNAALLVPGAEKTAATVGSRIREVGAGRGCARLTWRPVRRRVWYFRPISSHSSADCRRRVPDRTARSAGPRPAIERARSWERACWSPPRLRGSPVLTASQTRGGRAPPCQMRVDSPPTEGPPVARGRCASTRSSSRASRGRRRALGADAPRSCTPTATASTSPSRTGAIVGVRGRAADRVNHGRLGPEGPVRLAGERRRRPADAPAGPRGRRAGRDRLGHRDGPDRRPLAASCSTSPGGWGRFGFYTQRPAVPRGVLHARGDRQGRHRHAAHGRQHAAVHGDRRGGAQGELRHRRAARLVHRRRPLRRDRAVGPQRRRDADGAVDAHARPPARRRPAAACWPSTRDRRRWRGRPTCTSPRATARTWR